MLPKPVLQSSGQMEIHLQQKSIQRWPNSTVSCLFLKLLQKLAPISLRFELILTKKPLMIVLLITGSNNIMDFKTSAYFFPANCHRMKKTKIDTTILSAYRKQIKSHLSCFITSHQSPPSRPQTKISIKKRRYTAMSAGKFQLGRRQTELAVKEEEQVQKLPGSSLGLFKLLQNAKKLQREELKMQDNPFYKIQKKRLLKGKLAPKMGDLAKQKTKILNEGSSVSSSELEKKLFQNQSLSKLVADEAKTRTKSQTVTYYQIKNYYEQKYGSKLIELRQVEDKQ